jgi:hypothetical protein
MSDLGRLLPPGFSQQYWDTFGELPPEDFLEAYELLCEVFYYGSRLAPEPGDEGNRGKQYHTGIWFGGDQLWSFKAATDDRLASIRTALRSWSASRARESARRSRSARDGGGNLAAARGARDRGPAAGATQEET